jgi:hypothetical protein
MRAVISVGISLRSDGLSSVNSVLNPDKNCATITINVSDFYALINLVKALEEANQVRDERITRLEDVVVTSQREALRKQLGFLEDAYQLQRTYEKRIR